MAIRAVLYLCMSVLLFACTNDTSRPTENQGGKSRPVEIDPSRQTPEAAYTALRNAWNAGDYETAFTYLTPQAQQSVVASHAVLIGLWRGMGTQEMRESEFGQALEAMLAERGIESIGRRFSEIEKEIVPPGEDDDPYHVQTLLRVACELGDPLIFIQDLNRLDRQLNERPEFNVPLFPMNEVSIDGQVAEGWMGDPDGGELSLDFRLTDEGWMIDKLFPYPMNEPGGNKYRFEGEIEEF